MRSDTCGWCEYIVKGFTPRITISHGFRGIKLMYILPYLNSAEVWAVVTVKVQVTRYSTLTGRYRHGNEESTATEPFKDEAQTALFKDPVRTAL